MRQTQLFTKTQKEAPADEQAKNAQLLIRAGYLHKEMAGVYQLLPLGLRVVEKIKQIVREEMNEIGAQEMLATAMQSKEVWERTNRWDDEIVDVWFKSDLKAGGEIGFGWSHEEPLANMMRNHIASYKDLPKMIYQFQNKLRNELRAKSGIMRGREFLMKDAYSFADTEEQHETMYEAQKQAYTKVFERVGIGEDTYVTFAAGGAFTEFSHEFQTICEAGEDITYICKEKGIAINEEVLEQANLAELGVAREELVETKTAEVGNIFNFGRHKAEDAGLFYNNEAGERTAVWMGSYGIGVTRVMGVVVEKFADEKGVVWPASIAPYQVHLVGLNLEDEEIRDWADGIYAALKNRGVDVLFDDRDARPGEKFADSDLIGIPYRVVVSRKGKEAGTFEVVTRATGEVRNLTEEELYADFASESID
ncbi:MAG: prolyl-tRNA synthetase [Candidatus Kaiserbacteria bacterium]|nr:prolyl-tRNA synthetase [Candidatus Kaiserbacteria bacterium]MCB9816132.1 prolyl-tRNA synthetase [Candidatus Nomurabacteria bacterium]